MYLLKTCFPLLAVTCLASSLAPTASAVNLVANGDFELASNGANKQIHSVAGSEFTALTGWYTTNLPITAAEPVARPSLNLLFAEGAGETIGAANRFPADVFFWGASNLGAGVFNGVSPTGGNYVALDGGFDIGSLNQQLSGFTVGQDYTLKFSWAVAEQLGKEAPDGLTEKLVVKLGGQTIETPVKSYVNRGFDGWFSQTMTFTADSTSPILSFLSAGTPTGAPPFALLDGVSLEVVPEPSSFLISACALSTLMLRRRRSVEVA